MSSSFNPASLTGQCKDAMCDYMKVSAEGAAVMMKQMYPDDIPECCLQEPSAMMMQGLGQYQCPGAATLPTTTVPSSLMPSCRVEAALTAGMSARASCMSFDRSVSPSDCIKGDNKCAAPCTMYYMITDSASYMSLGMALRKSDEADLGTDPLGGYNGPYGSQSVQITDDNVAEVNSKYVLQKTCQQVMSTHKAPEPCQPMGDKICSEGSREMFIKMIEAQEDMMRLQRNDECDFNMGGMYQDSDTCGMLELNPSRTMFFLCGFTYVPTYRVGADLTEIVKENKKTYCGDWVSNPDGQCSSDRGFEKCSLANGPVAIKESECEGNAFLQKFVKGSDENPYCGPLQNGGCCVASMFHALTADNDHSLWPLCVTTWAKETCGINFDFTCSNEEVEQIAVVDVEIILEVGRRLEESSRTAASCTNKEADLLSRKLGKALNETSEDAKNAGARPIIISDTSCLGNSENRTITVDFVMEGKLGASSKDLATHREAVIKAAQSTDFQANLKVAGITASKINVKGAAGGAANTTNTGGNGNKSAKTTPTATSSSSDMAIHLSTAAVVTAFTAHVSSWAS